MTNMNDTWHDIWSSSSSEENEIIVEKEELANNILKTHIPCYHKVSPSKTLKWSIDDGDKAVFIAFTLLATYCIIIQKLKATNVFKQ